jgi:multiple sugar transport system permease protein
MNTELNPSARRRRNIFTAFSFLGPNFLGFALFTAWPVAAAFLLSFTSWDLLTPPRFAGVSNYTELLGFHRTADGLIANDPNFWRYLGNTVFLMLGLPINMGLSLFLAILLNQKIRGTYFYRLIFFMPSVLSGVAIFYLWRWMYNPDYGLINTMLAAIGIEGPRWLTEVAWAKPALMIMGSWVSAGGTSMILYLAALQNAPLELYEAAEIDGANGWQRFCNVTWPSVAPVTFFILTMGLIGGFQSGFEAAFIMTGGGPDGSTTTIGYYIYSTAYNAFEMGYAAAIAWVLFMIVLVVTLINWRHGKHNVTV